MFPIPQSSTGYPLVFLMSDPNGNGQTGLSPTVVLSKNGGAFGSPAGAVSEIANGYYAVAGNATDTGTLGSLVLYATDSTGVALPSTMIYWVTAANIYDGVRMGLTALPNAVAGAAGGLPTGDASGRIDLGKWLGSAPNALQSGRVDGYLGAVATGVIAAASFAANALDAVWSTAARTLTAISDSSGVTTLLSRIVGTLATGTHNPQSGDAYARIGAAGAGLTALGDTRIANLDATVSGVPAALLDSTAGVETGLTLRQAMRLLIAANAGKVSGGGTTTITIRNYADTKNRIVATVDASGNRSAITYDLS